MSSQKGKSSKKKTGNKKIDNTIRIKNQGNEFQLESDEEYENHDNKKVKTELYSDTKIVIPAPVVFNKQYVAEALSLVRKFGANHNTLYLHLTDFYLF
jgi:hypothetical protein